MLEVTPKRAIKAPAACSWSPQKESAKALFKAAVSKKLSAINRVLNQCHEHVSPKYTPEERLKYNMTEEYGGITGTLVPQSFFKIMETLSTSLPEEYAINNESVFCDVGCGTGRPVFYMATVSIAASVGFDIDPMQVYNSCQSHVRLERHEGKTNTKILNCENVRLFQMNAMDIDDLAPVTHVYSFIGYPRLVSTLTQLVARSLTVKVFIAVVLHANELNNTGIVDDMSDVTVIHGVRMPAGNAYSAYIIPMTAERRRRLLQKSPRSPKRGRVSCPAFAV